jgi:hypothetical protein
VDDYHMASGMKSVVTIVLSRLVRQTLDEATNSE